MGFLLQRESNPIIVAGLCHVIAVDAGATSEQRRLLSSLGQHLPDWNRLGAD
ncbi:MAG: hypothetical protein ACKOZT_11740 [Cyanobium sp.]